MHLVNALTKTPLIDWNIHLLPRMLKAFGILNERRWVQISATVANSIEQFKIKFILIVFGKWSAKLNKLRLKIHDHIKKDLNMKNFNQLLWMNYWTERWNSGLQPAVLYKHDLQIYLVPHIKIMFFSPTIYSNSQARNVVFGGKKKHFMCELEINSHVMIWARMIWFLFWLYIFLKTTWMVIIVCKCWKDG